MDFQFTPAILQSEKNGLWDTPLPNQNKLCSVNPIPYGGGGGGGVFFPPPKTDIANYGVFCNENMLFYYLTFHITGLPNFWRKNNLKFFGGTPPSGPLKI